jgi:hypothetical protein
MTTVQLKAYEIFKKQFQNEDDAFTIMEFFEKEVEEKVLQKKDVFLTKDDKIELIKEIKETKADMIKWMFLFLIGQIGVGVVMYFLNKK